MRLSVILLVGLAAVPGAAAQAPTVPPPPAPVPVEGDSLYAAGQYARARAAYDAFLTANPTSLPTRVRAGFAALRINRPDDAIGYFRTVVEQAPAGRAPVALAGLAMAYALKHDRSQALDHLERAEAAGYLNSESLDSDDAFAGVRDDPRFAAVRQKVYDRRFPCAADPRARAFDFWIGEWDAYTNTTGQLAGHSVIQRASGGCMILENWTSYVTPWGGGGPYEGKSMNFVDTVSGKWKQVWAGSQRDLTTFEEGEYRDGAMRFTYTNTNAQGQPVSGNFIFYNLGPNKVRQYQDVTNDGGKTYQVVYDFIYIRKGSGEAVTTAAPSDR